MPKRAAIRRSVLLAGLACAWLLLACAPALAHASLVEASPPQGSEVSTPPDRVELRFSEPVDAEFDPVVVRADGGARVDTHDARVDPGNATSIVTDRLLLFPSFDCCESWPRLSMIGGFKPNAALRRAVSFGMANGNWCRNRQGRSLDECGAGSGGRNNPCEVRREEATGKPRGAPVGRRLCDVRRTPQG